MLASAISAMKLAVRAVCRNARRSLGLVWQPLTDGCGGKYMHAEEEAC